MKVYDWSDIYSNYQNKQILPQFQNLSAGISVGSFDGIHKGHSKLLATVLEESKKNNYLAGALTFARPLPNLKKSHYEGDISTLNQRLNIFEKIGLDFVIVVAFTQDFAALSGEKFFEILLETCNLKLIVEGIDFRCGYKGATTAKELEEFGKFKKIQTIFVSPVFFMDEETKTQQRVSSTYIRQCIKNKKFNMAAELLNRKFCLSMPVFPYDENKSDYKFSLKDFTQVLPPQGNYLVEFIGKKLLLTIKDEVVVLNFAATEFIENNRADFLIDFQA